MHQEAIHSCSLRTQTLLSEAQQLQSLLQDTEQQLKSAGSRNAELAAKLAGTEVLGSQNATLHRNLEELRVCVAERDQEARELRDEIVERTPRKNAEARLETLQREIFRLKSSLGDLETRNREAEVEMMQMRERVAQHRCNMNELEHARNSLRALSEQAQHHERMSKNLEIMEHSRKAAQEEIQTLRMALEASTSSLEGSNLKCRHLEVNLSGRALLACKVGLFSS